MERLTKRQKRSESAHLPSPATAQDESKGAASAPAPSSLQRNDGRSFQLTRLKNAPPSHNEGAVGLQELLQGEFTRCLLTNYMFDLDWLFGECPRLASVPVVLVHGERDRLSMDQACASFTNVTPVAPPLPIPYGTHHTKMVVVLYPTKVRVAIFTANFIAIDWNNKTQGVWHQEFELKVLADSSDEEGEEQAAGKGPQPPSSQGKPAIKLPNFEADLVEYLSALGPAVAAFCRELRRFDFSTARVALVPSIPGVHKGRDMEKFGHLRVRRLLRDLQVPPTDHPLICQFSSLGSLDEKWLFGEFAASLMPGKKNVSPASAPVQALHIVWPSVNDVRNSNEGWNAGRAVPCPLKNMKPFLHKYLRKWTPPPVIHRQNAMPHIKTYARFDPSDSNGGAIDWALLTSSNLSKAAWGAYQKNQTQFMIRSYELGIMFLPALLAGPPKGLEDQPLRLGVVGSTVASLEDARLLLPLPFAFPLATYDPKKDEPWVWDLVRGEPDVFGERYNPH